MVFRSIPSFMAACLLRVIRVVTAGEGMGLIVRVEMVV